MDMNYLIDFNQIINKVNKMINLNFLRMIILLYKTNIN